MGEPDRFDDPQPPGTTPLGFVVAMLVSLIVLVSLSPGFGVVVAAIVATMTGFLVLLLDRMSSRP